MFDIATSNSKKVIITSDDLHDESFDSILKDMVENNKHSNYDVISARGLAIKEGLKLIGEKDILLILGKGHEEYIIVKDKKIPFNDRKEVEKIINEQINI